MVGPLDHKLLRDLWGMKGQALAIMAVVAVGVMLQVMMSGLVVSLTETRDAYYQRYRLADIFAPVSRAPERVVDQVSDISGVQAAASRITGTALISMPDLALPAQARVISLPDRARPLVNDIYLTAGRLPQTDHPDEVVFWRGLLKRMT